MYMFNLVNSNLKYFYNMVRGGPNGIDRGLTQYLGLKKRKQILFN